MATAVRAIRVAAKQAEQAGLLIAYKGDVEHDVTALKGYRAPFLWSVRDTGTHLGILEGPPMSPSSLDDEAVWVKIATRWYNSTARTFLFSPHEWSDLAVRHSFVADWYVYELTDRGDLVRDIITACATGRCP